VDISPDKRWLLSGFGNSLRQWDITSREIVQTLDGHPKGIGIDAINFSSDGHKAVSWSRLDGTIRLWDLDTGVLRQTLVGQEGIDCVKFCPDGKLLVLGGKDGTLRLWNVLDDSSVVLNGPESSFTCIAVSGDGRQILSGDFWGQLQLWDFESKRCVESFRAHNEPVLSVSFSPDGRSAASGSQDYTVKLWDIASRQCIRTLQGHEGPVTSVAFLPDGYGLASASWDQTMRLWELDWELEFPEKRPA
jgi:WD40 repeat protein